MSHHQGDDADYMADEYEMEDGDDDMDEEFRGRDTGGSDSDVDEYDHLVCDITSKLINTLLYSVMSVVHALFISFPGFILSVYFTLGMNVLLQGTYNRKKRGNIFTLRSICDI